MYSSPMDLKPKVQEESFEVVNEDNEQIDIKDDNLNPEKNIMY